MAAAWAVFLACVLLAVPTALWPGERLASDTYLAGLTLIVGALWWGRAWPRRPPAGAGP
jgi:hypothetical protein